MFVDQVVHFCWEVEICPAKVVQFVILHMYTTLAGKSKFVQQKQCTSSFCTCTLLLLGSRNLSSKSSGSSFCTCTLLWLGSRNLSSKSSVLRHFAHVHYFCWEVESPAKSVVRHFAHVHYFGWEVEICPAKVVYFVILHMYTTFAGKSKFVQQKQCSSSFCTCTLLWLGVRRRNFTSKSSVLRHFAHVHYFCWEVEICPAKVVQFVILHMYTTLAAGKQKQCSSSKFVQQKQCTSSFCTCTLLLGSWCSSSFSKLWLGSRNLSSKSSVLRHFRHFAHVHYFCWEVEICPAKVVQFVILHMYTTFAGKSKFVQQKQCSSSFCTCTLLWLGSRNLSSKSSVLRHFAHVHYFCWEVEICPAKVVQFVILHMYTTTLAGKSSSKSSVLRHFAHVHYFCWEVEICPAKVVQFVILHMYTTFAGKSKFVQQKQCSSSFCTCTLLWLGHRNFTSKSSVLRHFAHVHYFCWEVLQQKQCMSFCTCTLLWLGSRNLLYTTFAGKSKFEQCSSSFCTCTLLWLGHRNFTSKSSVHFRTHFARNVALLLLGSRNLSSKSSVVRHFAHVHYFCWEVEICPAKVVQFVILHMYTTLAGKFYSKSRNLSSKSSVLRHFAHVHYFCWEVEICPAKVVQFVILHMYTTLAGKSKFSQFVILHMYTTFAGKSKFVQQKQCSSSFCTCTLLWLGHRNFTSKSSVLRHFAHVHYFCWEVEICPAKVVYFDILHMYTTFAGKSKFVQQKQCSSSFCTCTLLWLGHRNFTSKSSVLRHFAHVHYFCWEVEICPAKVVYFDILHMYTTFAGKSKFVQQKQCSSSFCTCTLLWLGHRNFTSKSSVLRHFAHVHYFCWEVEICPAKVVQFVILHMYTTLAGTSKIYQQKQCTSSFGSQMAVDVICGCIRCRVV